MNNDTCRLRAAKHERDPTMFSSLFSSFGKLFGSSKVARGSKPVTQRVSLQVESLEGRALPSAVSASAVESYVLQHLQNAISDVQLAKTFFQGNDLRDTSTCLQYAEQELYQSANGVVWGYYNANIPLNQAENALKALNAYYNRVASCENAIVNALNAQPSISTGQVGTGYSGLYAQGQYDLAAIANTTAGYDSTQLFNYGSDVMTYAGPGSTAEPGASSDGSDSSY